MYVRFTTDQQNKNVLLHEIPQYPRVTWSLNPDYANNPVYLESHWSHNRSTISEFSEEQSMSSSSSYGASASGVVVYIHKKLSDENRIKSFVAKSHLQRGGEQKTNWLWTVAGFFNRSESGKIRRLILPSQWRRDGRHWRTSSSSSITTTATKSTKDDDRIAQVIHHPSDDYDLQKGWW